MGQKLKGISSHMLQQLTRIMQSIVTKTKFCDFFSIFSLISRHRGKEKISGGDRASIENIYLGSRSLTFPFVKITEQIVRTSAAVLIAFSLSTGQSRLFLTSCQSRSSTPPCLPRQRQEEAKMLSKSFSVAAVLTALMPR